MGNWTEGNTDQILLDPFSIPLNMLLGNNLSPSPRRLLARMDERTALGGNLAR